MTFRETLDRHLQAIRDRNLDAFRETVAPSGLIVVMANGRLVRDTAEFLGLHRDWFTDTAWTVEFEPVSIREWSDVGVAVFRLIYRERPQGKPPIHETSYLTLVFARREDGWEMVHDQNTPEKKQQAKEVASSQ